MTQVLLGVLEELDTEPTALSLGKIKELAMPNTLFEDQFSFPQLGYFYGPIPMNGGGVVWQSGIQQANAYVSASWRFLSDLGNTRIAWNSCNISNPCTSTCSYSYFTSYVVDLWVDLPFLAIPRLASNR